MIRQLQRYGGILAVTALTGCTSLPQPPLATVERVELERFMGDWYVIANIPTFIERGAHNALESYRLDTDGSIATTFSFRRGGFDGKRVEYTPRGFVTDTESNAIWGMQFIWPIKADFRITYLDADYTVTAIGRQKRDFVWIMARTPEISAARYRAVLDHLASQGYDIDRIESVPQRWPDTQP